MRYKSDVPKEKQIRLSQFRLFPGDRVLIKIRSVFYWGNVVEVCSANPEYVLGGAGAKGAGLPRISLGRPQRRADSPQKKHVGRNWIQHAPRPVGPSCYQQRGNDKNFYI